MTIGFVVASGLNLRGGCDEQNFFRTLPRLIRLTDFIEFGTQICQVRKYLAGFGTIYLT